MTSREQLVQRVQVQTVFTPVKITELWVNKAKNTLFTIRSGYINNDRFRNAGIGGYEWSSRERVTNTNAYFFAFTHTNVFPSGDGTAGYNGLHYHGFPLRYLAKQCIIKCNVFDKRNLMYRCLLLLPPQTLPETRITCSDFLSRNSIRKMRHLVICKMLYIIEQEQKFLPLSLHGKLQ